ncbi:MAG: hypothetical protein AAFR96_13440 [Planctomycetota bacterium]
MADPEKFEVAIPSNTTIAQEVQERIIASLESRNYSKRDVFGTRLSLEEAITVSVTAKVTYSDTPPSWIGG